MAARNHTMYPDGLSSAAGDNAIDLRTLTATGEPPQGLTIENYTLQTVYVAYDAAASLGSRPLPAGMIAQDPGVRCGVLHLYTPSSGVSINGTSKSGIIVSVFN